MNSKIMQYRINFKIIIMNLMTIINRSINPNYKIIFCHIISTWLFLVRLWVIWALREQINDKIITLFVLYFLHVKKNWNLEPLWKIPEYALGMHILILPSQTANLSVMKVLQQCTHFTVYIGLRNFYTRRLLPGSWSTTFSCSILVTRDPFLPV